MPHADTFPNGMTKMGCARYLEVFDARDRDDLWRRLDKPALVAACVGALDGAAAVAVAGGAERGRGRGGVAAATAGRAGRGRGHGRRGR